MSSPQLENGYTRIANELLERLTLPGINGSEYRIVIFVLRKTYGFQKKQDRIPLSQFQKGLEMKRANVVRTIKTLVAKRILAKDKNTYSINKNWEQWVVAKRILGTSASSQTDTKGSSQTDNLLVAKRIHSKETLQKKKEMGNVLTDTKTGTGLKKEEELYTLESEAIKERIEVEKEKIRKTLTSII